MRKVYSTAARQNRQAPSIQWMLPGNVSNSIGNFEIGQGDIAASEKLTGCYLTNRELLSECWFFRATAILALQWLALC